MLKFESFLVKLTFSQYSRWKTNETDSFLDLSLWVLRNEEREYPSVSLAYIGMDFSSILIVIYLIALHYATAHHFKLHFYMAALQLQTFYYIIYNDILLAVFILQEQCKNGYNNANAVFISCLLRIQG